VTRGRVIVVVMLAAYFVLLAVLGGAGRWDRLGVEPVSPSFVDLRSVTSGWECTRAGVDVLPRNPCDPLGGRPANYPHVWMWPAVLGLGQGSTVALGVLVAIAFFAAAVLVLPRDARWPDAVVYGLALCAPAVMLGVQRGNVDLALFVLVVAGVLVLRRGTAGAWGGTGLILLAAILKLFPIFALIVLARLPLRRALVLGGTAVGLFAAYVLVTLDNIRLTRKVVPQTDYLSFGVRRFTHWLNGELNAGWAWASGLVHERLGLAGLDALVLGVTVAAVLVAALAAPRFAPANGDTVRHRELDLFYAGAGIYVCSYALFRSWDYRLVFILLTIPQLVRWARRGNPIGFLGLTGAAGALWLDAEPFAFGDGLTAAVAAQLLLFVALVAGLAGPIAGRRLRRSPA
jgi:glycosyl transferase family 87